jgi:hypothetical protein
MLEILDRVVKEAAGYMVTDEVSFVPILVLVLYEEACHLDRWDQFHSMR